MNIVETILNISTEHIRNLFGEFDCHAKLIEKTMEVTLIARDGELKILGETNRVQKTKVVIEELLKLSIKGNAITEQNVTYALALSLEDKVDAINEIDKDLICHTIQGKPIKPKTPGLSILKEMLFTTFLFLKLLFKSTISNPIKAPFILFTFIVTQKQNNINNNV